VSAVAEVKGHVEGAFVFATGRWRHRQARGALHSQEAGRGHGRLVDADELAAILGTTRHTVYRHATELGRTGWASLAGRCSTWDEALARMPVQPVAAEPPKVKRRRRAPVGDVALLPVGPEKRRAA